MLAGILVAALAVVAVAVAISVGPGHNGLARANQARQLYTQVNLLLAGIPEHGTVLGNPRARVTLTFFGDLQCPVCAAFATGANLDGVAGGLPQFVTDQVRSGHVKIIYRSLCTATCNDFSNGQALFNEQQTAAYAAGEQNKFWYYEELFYRQQGPEGSPYVTNGFLVHLAQQIPGLDLKRWSSDRGDPRLLSRVQADERAAITELPMVNGGRGTPGLVISGPKGLRFINEGDTSYPQLQAALKAVV